MDILQETQLQRYVPRPHYSHCPQLADFPDQVGPTCQPSLWEGSQTHSSKDVMLWTQAQPLACPPPGQHRFTKATQDPWPPALPDPKPRPPSPNKDPEEEVWVGAGGEQLPQQGGTYLGGNLPGGGPGRLLRGDTGARVSGEGPLVAGCPALWFPHFRDRTGTVSNPQEDSTRPGAPTGSALRGEMP